MNPLLDIEEAARIVGLSKWALYDARKKGQLKAGRLGCKFRVTREELERWATNPARQGRPAGDER
jgi:excisionase family DNA binding protein